MAAGLAKAERIISGRVAVPSPLMAAAPELSTTSKAANRLTLTE